MAARAARVREARGTQPLRLGNDAESNLFSPARKAAPVLPTSLVVTEMRRDGKSATGERFPNLVVTGDEVYIEVELDARPSETEDLHNEKVESSGQLSTVESGAVDSDGLKYFFKLKAIKAGTEPTSLRIWDEEGNKLEVTVWFEVVSPSELRRRMHHGELGGKSGEMRGPRDRATPYASPKHRDKPSTKNVLRTSQHHAERHAASSAGRSDWEGLGYAYANAELDRSESDPRLRKRVGAYVDGVESKDVANNLPQPLPAFVGYPAYYEARHEDFIRRNPGAKPPDYYLKYGKKYAQRFTNALFPHLSAKGKAWLIRARTLLQLAFEDRILAGPADYEQLERKNDAFREYAYDTHASAYLDAGLADLSVADQYRIGTTPDFFDLFSGDGLAQVIAVLPDVAKGVGRKVAKPYRDIGSKTKRALTDPRVWGLR